MTRACPPSSLLTHPCLLILPVSFLSPVPFPLSLLSQGAIVVGFVANVTGSGVFVRFGGRVTGLAPLSQIGDAFVSNPQELFAIGQTVRAQVLSVDAEASKAVLSLRPPAGLSEEGAPFLTSLLKDLRDVDSLAAKKEGTERWAGAFPLGGLVKGKVAEVKDFGVVVDLPGHPDVVGAALGPFAPTAYRPPFTVHCTPANDHALLRPLHCASLTAPVPPSLVFWMFRGGLSSTFPSDASIAPAPLRSLSSLQRSSRLSRQRARSSPRVPPSRRAFSTSQRPMASSTWA